MPGAPPRRVDVDVLNSTALKVMWRSLAPGKQHGQIRGYQVHYVRVENGESRGLPLIKDVMLADAQVRPRPLTMHSLSSPPSPPLLNGGAECQHIAAIETLVVFLVREMGGSESTRLVERGGDLTSPGLRDRFPLSLEMNYIFTIALFLLS